MKGRKIKSLIMSNMFFLSSALECQEMHNKPHVLESEQGPFFTEDIFVLVWSNSEGSFETQGPVWFHDHVRQWEHTP